MHCPHHDGTVLLSEEAIVALELVEGGIDVHYRCTCGYEGVWRTGRERPPARLAGSRR